MNNSFWILSQFIVKTKDSSYMLHTNSIIVITPILESV